MKKLGGWYYKLRTYEEGREQGLEQGREEGMDKLASLTNMLLKQNRLKDIERISSDKDYRNKLPKEFHLD